MTRRFLYTATASACILLCSGSAIAQFGRGGGGWSTAGGDAQRTGWVRTDPQISKENIAKGIVQFLWKTKLDNAPRQMNALTPPAVIGRVITYKGFKDLMFIAGSSDTVWSIDHPLGKVFWEAKLPYAATYPQQKGGTAACPGGMTAAVTMAASFGAGGGGTPGRARRWRWRPGRSWRPRRGCRWSRTCCRSGRRWTSRWSRRRGARRSSPRIAHAGRDVCPLERRHAAHHESA